MRRKSPSKSSSRCAGGIRIDQIVLPRRDLPTGALQRVSVGLVFLCQFAQQLFGILLVEDAETGCRPADGHERDAR